MSNQPSPLNAGPYSRFMVNMYDDREIIGVPTGFLSFFGRGGALGNTVFSPDANLVMIDILRGNLKAAALIHRGQASRSVEGLKEASGDKFTEFSRAYPLAEEIDSINAEDLNYRVAGEPVFQSGITKRDRLRLLAARKHNENIRRLVRLWEILAAQSILTGQQVGILGTTNSDLIYDFRRNAAYVATPSPKWDGVSPTILADIDGRCEFVRETGHMTPDMAIMGDAIIEPFLSDTTVLSLADNRRIELIEVSTNNPVPTKFDRFIDSGMIARGRLRTPKGYTLWLFSYIDTYQNDAGTHVKFMPADEMLICSSQARCDRYFGPSDVLPLTSARTAEFMELLGFSLAAAPMPQNIQGASGIVPPAAFYHDAYTEGENKTVTVRTQCAPIFAPASTDVFGKLENILT
jgi:hypothetical protein